MGGFDTQWEFGTGTGEVASSVVDFDLGSVSSDVEREVRRTVVETLGALSAGHAIGETPVVVEYVKETFTTGDATILDGSGYETRTEGAVLANCVAANALDIDEGNRRGDGHPASMVVPVALAVAEERDATVREFLEAVLVGYEVANRAGEARRTVVEYHNGTGSWAAVGTAAAAGKLRELDTEKLEDALGMADFNSPVTPVMRSVANPGNGLTKDGIGWGGYVAITAVEMAERGLNGSGTVFDHEAVTAHEDLWENFSFEHQYVKPYPGCRWTHAGIDAVRELYDEHAIDPGSIRSVDVYTFEQGAFLRTRYPAHADEAQYSYPYPLAVALVAGDVTPADLKRDSLADDEIREMIDLIDLHFDPDLVDEYGGNWGARVEIHTGNGTYSEEVRDPRGSPRRPLSDEEFREKMRKLFDEHPDPDSYGDVVEVVSTPDAPVTDLVDVWRPSATP